MDASVSGGPLSERRRAESGGGLGFVGMSRIDDLPADQRATLQLLLKQGKNYDELAGLLRLEPHAVRERALNALDALGPETAARLAPERQDEISDYLLGQQRASQRAATRSFLEGSASGRTWARTVSSELRPLAGDALPDIPAEAAEIDEAFGALSARTQARERQDQSSKVGGVILLIGAAAVVAVLVVLIVSRLGDDGSSTDTSASGNDTPTSTQADTTSTPTSGTAGTADPNGGVEAQIPMKGSNGSDAVAAGFIVDQGSGRALGISGQNFAPTTDKFAYAVWLYTSPEKAVRLGYVGGGVPSSGQNKGRLETGADPATIEQAAAQSKDTKEKAALKQTAQEIRAALKNVYDYKELIITREPVDKQATKPGEIVASGPIVKPGS